MILFSDSVGLTYEFVDVVYLNIRGIIEAYTVVIHSVVLSFKTPSFACFIDSLNFCLLHSSAET